MRTSGEALISHQRRRIAEFRRRLKHGARSFFPRKRWSKTEHLLAGSHPISRLSLLGSKFVAESLLPRAGHWPYPPGELQLMTVVMLWRQPDVIFEWGTNLGNSARIFHWIAEAFEIDTEIHSIDLPPETSHVQNIRELRGVLVRGFSDVHLHLGDGVNKALELFDALKPQRPLFYVDGDHRAEAVTRELEAIRATVPTAPILLDDTHDWEIPDSPRPAMLQFLERHHGDYEVFENVATLPGMSLLVPKQALATTATPPSG
jgi:cephalosporin hydroxylase